MLIKKEGVTNESALFQNEGGATHTLPFWFNQTAAILCHVYFVNNA